MPTTPTPAPTPTPDPIVEQIRHEIATRGRFLITSHLKPDGDSIGSQMALAYALRDLGKQVRVVNRDAPPPSLLMFPGVPDIQVGETAEGPIDAVVVMECGDLARTGLRDLERHFIINIDHHPGNSHFGAINWFDAGAAACGEMIFELVRRLGVPLSREIATHVYLAILTDTGSFHYSSISPRTFDICRDALEAGVDPVMVARNVFDSNNLGRLKLFGAVLNSIELDPTGRLAVIYLNREMARQAGGTYDDTEGLINLPLTVREIQAVVFFKEAAEGEYRVSMRSKDAIDVGAVAKGLGGGGHKNASGCTVHGPYRDVRDRLVGLITRAIDATGA
ncbi:MAG: bifunctional oligoribonuclease/PAP phosphatase NrnA [Acidobacteria bacterium]|nr:bifunctional oligoribonuclease/PAP phosphatase NrnA [Acidobacteriota bacterium]